MDPRAQKELLALFQDAIKVGGAAVEMRLRRFASLIRTSDEALATAITPLVTGLRTLRRETQVAPPPVDQDSKLPLVRVDPPGGNRPTPVLAPDMQAAIDQIIGERKASERLVAEGLVPIRSVLMSGPPGVGKTMTAGWLAEQLDLPLYTLDLASVMSSFLGRTGANVRSVLNHAQQQPCVLLLDEFDAIAKRRNDDGDVGELKRLVTVILQTIDDWTPMSLLVAATNHGELLDPAVWRRFDVTLKFGMPGQEQRQAVLSARGLSPVLAEGIATLTEGQTMASLARAIDASRKKAILTDQPFEEALIDWVKVNVHASPQGTRAYRAAQRDVTVLLQHARGMPARDIASIVGASHTTVLRTLSRLKGDNHGRT